MKREPAEIDLGPDDYKTKGPDGRWQIPDDPRVLIFGIVLDIAILVAVYVNRAEISSGSALLLSIILAFSAGLLVARLFKNVY